MTESVSSASSRSGGRFRSADRILLVAAVAGALGLLAALVWPALFGDIYLYDDLQTFYLPTRIHYAQALKSGHSFLWMPELFCGFDVHGEGQAGMYHPLHLLLYRLLPVDVAFNAEVLLSLPLAWLGAWLLARRWSFSPGVSAAAATALAFCGGFFLHACHPTPLFVVAHIPWLLLAVDVAAKDPLRRPWALMATAALVASILLAGAPQFAWFVCLLTLLYALYLRLTTRRRIGAGWLAAAAICGVLLGALQWLPTYDAASRSPRSRPSLRARYWDRLHVADVAQLWGPYLYRRRAWKIDGHEATFYAGAGVSALLGWLALRRKHLAARKGLVRGALVLAGLSFLLALGKEGLLYRIHAHLPVIHYFRVPARYTYLTYVAIFALAAVAMEDLLRSGGEVEARRRARWLWILPALSVATAVGALIAIRVSESIAKRFASTGLILAGPALILAATALVALAAAGRRWAPALLALMLAADLGVYGISYMRKRPPAPLAAVVAASPRPPQPTAHRVMFDPDLIARNLPALNGSRAVDGYVGVTPPHVLDYSCPQARQVAEVEWVYDEGEWRRLDPVLPRARLVSHATFSSDPARDIATIDPAVTALVGEDVPLPDSEPGSADIARDEPGEVHVVTRAPAMQLLVLSERYDPGWRAEVDGRAQPVLPVYGDFMGCLVPAGEHLAAFRFRPPGVLWGGRTAAAGLVATACLGAAAFLRSRRGRDAHA